MKKLFSLSAAALLFVACGDDSSTGSNTENKDSYATKVESIYDLGKCSSDRKGDVVYVEDEDSDYLCVNDDWKNIGKSESSSSKTGDKEDGKPSANDKSSSSANDGSSGSQKDDATTENPESSNGSSPDKAESTDSKNPGSNDTADSGSSDAPESSSSIQESSSSIVPSDKVVENVAITKMTFTGVAEKGPYMSGTTIKLSELDDEMDPTGTTFDWEVTSDLGAYTSTKVTLKSQYALLQANGYYYNENTAKTTANQVSLKSLIDLNGRTSANINILGHLAYKRTVNLFVESGKFKNIPAAKSQAEKEVLAAFGWPTNNHAFEDLSIFGTYEDDAKLLAASILLQEGLSDVDMTSRLTVLATDFEEDGLWSDSAAKVKAADWAMDTTRKFSKTRTQLEELGGSVPNFEKYISLFVGNVYGIGVCNGERDGEKIKMTNAYSNNLGKIYACDDGKWRYPTTSENRVGKTCTASQKGTFASLFDAYDRETEYVCDGGNGNWRVSTVYDHPKEYYLNPDYKYGTLKDSRDGKTYKTTEIGLQTWMAENLNYYDKNNSNLVDNSWCYKNVEANCNVGGRLYTWTAAMNLDPKYAKTIADFLVESPHKGICPDGWHVPTNAEWLQVRNYISKMEGGSTGAYSEIMKSSKGWYPYSTSSKPSEDSYGFSAIATGAYYGKYANPKESYSRYAFDDEKYFANFWSATEATKYTGAVYWYLDYREYAIRSYEASYNEKDRGFALRCVKD